MSIVLSLRKNGRCVGITFNCADGSPSEQVPAEYSATSAREAADAEKEGVQFRLLVAPAEVIGNADGAVAGLRCTEMRLGAPDASGRRSAEPIPGSSVTLEADVIVAAIGMVPHPGGLDILINGKSYGEASREYSIKDSVLSRWRQEFVERAAVVFEAHAGADPWDARIAELERMVGRLATELEMVKKARSYLVSPSPRSGRL